MNPSPSGQVASSNSGKLLKRYCKADLLSWSLRRLNFETCLAQKIQDPVCVRVSFINFRVLAEMPATLVLHFFWPDHSPHLYTCSLVPQVGQVFAWIVKRLSLYYPWSSHVYSHLQSSSACHYSCATECFTNLDPAASKFQIKIKEALHIPFLISS